MHATATKSSAVENVSLSNELVETQRTKEDYEQYLGTPLEACDNYSADICKQPGCHSLIACIDTAYRLHLPLVLSPDHIWLTIAQGLATHVNVVTAAGGEEAAAIRKQFVDFEGKKNLTVRRDDFKRLSPENPWAETWPEFSSKIKEYIGDENHSLILSDFSTTGVVEKAASEIVLMGAVQAFFKYEISTLCGIPNVTLEGTVEDWEKIVDKTKALGRYGLDWWASKLVPILEEIVQTAKGNINQYFWSSIYKRSGRSGGPYLSGWCTLFFPYLRRCNGWFRNRLLDVQGDQEETFPTLTHDVLPQSVSQVPFVWNYFGKDFNYQFVGGILGFRQDRQTYAVRPNVGWAVRETRC